jgi:hypothetical protein
MANCFHQVVCRHYSSDEVMECECRDICKHFAEGQEIDVPRVVKAPKAKNARKDKNNLSDICVRPVKDSEVLEQFKKAKVFLASKRRDMSENQRLACDAVSGKHYTTLTEAQRQQIIDIASDLRGAE